MPIMTPSEQISRDFYDALGMDGLSARTRPEWDATIVAELEQMIAPDDEVLDVGCGYGRIAIPLALKGYKIRGVDLSPRLVREAQQVAADRSASVEFDVGSMCNLPYVAGSFDVALCIWSGFYELLQRDEQLLAVRSIHHVLRVGGWALLEGPVYSAPTDDEVATGRRRGPDLRIAADEVNGMSRPHFCHDLESLSSLCTEAGIVRHECCERDWAGRSRQFLRFWKS